MSKQQTAVEWLDVQITNLTAKPVFENGKLIEFYLPHAAELYELFNQAKQMEKEQTTEAYIAGSHHLPIPPKTYGGDHE